MDTIDQDVSWYALQVRPRFEKAVSKSLRSKGYEEFLPLYRQSTRWSDRTKEIELPLFPSYVFCRFNMHERLPILMVPGVNSVVCVAKIPAPIEAVELDNIRTLLQSGSHFDPWPYFEIGQMVEVERGSLAGTRGLIVRIKDSYRLVISINLLQRAVAVEIDRDCLKPISTSNVGLAAKSSDGSTVLVR